VSLVEEKDGRCEEGMTVARDEGEEGHGTQEGNTKGENGTL
jgi:hypothetical protein